MEIYSALAIYSFSVVAAILSLTLMAQVKLLQKTFFRVLAGGTAGGLTSAYLAGVVPLVSLIEYSVSGDFGIGGYLFFASIFLLVGVWIYNLINHQGVPVQ